MIQAGKDFDAAQAVPQTAGSVVSAILHNLHMTVASLLPVQNDGSVYYLQSGVYIQHLAQALNHRDTMRTHVENIGFPSMPRDQVPIAEQVLANTGAALDKIAAGREYTAIGAKLNDMRAELGLTPINWSKDIKPAAQQPGTSPAAP